MIETEPFAWIRRRQPTIDERSEIAWLRAIYFDEPAGSRTSQAAFATVHTIITSCQL